MSGNSESSNGGGGSGGGFSSRLCGSCCSGLGSSLSCGLRSGSISSGLSGGGLSGSLGSSFGEGGSLSGSLSGSGLSGSSLGSSLCSSLRNGAFGAAARSDVDSFWGWRDSFYHAFQQHQVSPAVVIPFTLIPSVQTGCGCFQLVIYALAIAERVNDRADVAVVTHDAVFGAVTKEGEELFIQGDDLFFFDDFLCTVFSLQIDLGAFSRFDDLAFFDQFTLLELANFTFGVGNGCFALNVGCFELSHDYPLNDELMSYVKTLMMRILSAGGK